MPKSGRKAGSSVGSTTKRAVNVKKIKIDCSTPVRDELIDAEGLASFAEYLTQRIKVNGKVNNLGNLVTVNSDDSTGDIVVETAVHLSKRYIKYLAKKFLCKKIITTEDGMKSTWKSLFRIHSDQKDKTAFKLKYVVTEDRKSVV